MLDVFQFDFSPTGYCGFSLQVVFDYFLFWSHLEWDWCWWEGTGTRVCCTGQRLCRSRDSPGLALQGHMLNWILRASKLHRAGSMPGQQQSKHSLNISLY